MIRTVEAVIDEHGNVRLLQTVQMPGARRALVMILDEPGPPVAETCTAQRRSTRKRLEQTRGGRGVVTPTAGAVVLVPFPFSDLSQVKLRPAVVLADAGRGDWILCQITSNPYGDPRAIELVDSSFAAGSLRVVSYARPGKLFTANRDVIVTQVGSLKGEPFTQIVEAVVDILRASLSS